MTSVARIAAPAQARHFATTAILALGIVIVLSPYAWLEEWRLVGFSGAYLPYHLWGLSPFALLAALIGRSYGISWLAAWVLVVPVVLGTVISLALTQSTGTGRTVSVGMPAVLLLTLIGAWQLQAHRRRGLQLPSLSLVAGVAALVAAAVVFGRLAAVGEYGRLQTFLVIGTSIVVEALPFVLLGAAVSAAIEVFAPDRWFAAIARLPLRLQVPCVALAGIAMPVCECGSVPVARRLIVRGVHPAAGVAFMLAAPVINPVVLFSTAVAYHGRNQLEMVLGRAGLGLLVAIVVGTIVARKGVPLRGEEHHAHHQHEGARVRGFVDHLAADLLLMGKFIVLGAALAAAMQTAVPQSVFTGALTSPFFGALIMIVLAFVLSLCSEADAFVAVSFIQFPLSSQLAFLAAGPVLDTKLAMLYGGTFGRAFVLRLAAVIVPVVLAGSLLFGLAV
ncbi:permease [Candidatus Solirubrobacter pratensis]|uniref:permease n=1 Tax=Candidatus Solirubrobacter pratensis TaxID=1298857 RepID=UPI00042A4EBA|nr:permease [Candidatus Solirubrobacter pratensis]